MAFVFKGERFNPVKPKEGDFYMDLKKYGQKKNIIPFNSSSVKFKKVEEKLSEKEKYKKEYYRLLDKKKEMIYNSIKNIGKRDKSNFEYQNRFKKERQFMDPGLYNFEIKKNEHNNLNNKLILKNTQYKKKNFPNKPSIPTNKKKILKKNRKTKSLANLPNNTHGSYLYKNNNVGPGRYEINDSEIIKRREKNIITWKNSSKRSVSLKLLQPFQKQVPIQYKNNIIEKPDKYKQSSFFTSNVFRKTFCEKDKNIKIGPGSYFNPKTQSSFKVQKKDEKFQFFSTSMVRFIPGKKLCSVDPGSYQAGSSFKDDNIYNSNYGQFSFGISSSRFNQRKQSVPGPDMYTSKKNFIKKSFNKRDYFISKQERFIKKKIELPDYSKIKEKKNIYKIVKKSKKKTYSVNKKNNYKKRTKQPEPGQYDITLNDISYRKKYKNNKELNKKKNEKLGFMSKENRFKNKKRIKKESDDDFYEESHYNILKDPIQENVVPFCSSKNRFENENNVKNPEYYSKRKPWNIKSFNITYN